MWGSQEWFDLNNIQAVAVLKLKHATCWNSSARRKKKTPRHFTDGQMGITLQYISHVQRDCVFPSLELFCVQQQETGFPHQLTNKKNKAAPGRSRAQSQKSDSWLIKQCCVCVCWSITLESLNPQIYPPYKHH